MIGTRNLGTVAESKITCISFHHLDMMFYAIGIFHLQEELLVQFCCINWELVCEICNCNDLLLPIMEMTYPVGKIVV